MAPKLTTPAAYADNILTRIRQEARMTEHAFRNSLDADQCKQIQTISKTADLAMSLETLEKKEEKLKSICDLVHYFPDENPLPGGLHKRLDHLSTLASRGLNAESEIEISRKQIIERCKSL